MHAGLRVRAVPSRPGMCGPAGEKTGADGKRGYLFADDAPQSRLYRFSVRGQAGAH